MLTELLDFEALVKAFHLASYHEGFVSARPEEIEGEWKHAETLANNAWQTVLEAFKAHVAELSAERDASDLAYTLQQPYVRELEAELAEVVAERDAVELKMHEAMAAEQKAYNALHIAEQLNAELTAQLGIWQRSLAASTEKVNQLEARLAVHLLCRQCQGGLVFPSKDCPSCGGTGVWP